MDECPVVSSMFRHENHEENRRQSEYVGVLLASKVAAILKSSPETARFI